LVNDLDNSITLKEVRCARERMNIKAFIANKSGKIIEHKSKEKEPNL
jgi:hypothetical protein